MPQEVQNKQSENGETGRTLGFWKMNRLIEHLMVRMAGRGAKSGKKPKKATDREVISLSFGGMRELLHIIILGS